MIVFALYFAARANLKPRQREKATLYVIIEYISLFSPIALCWEIPLHFTWLRSIHLPQQLNYQMYSVLRTKPKNTSSSSSSSSTKQGDAQRTRKSRNNTSSSSSTKQGDAQRTRKSRILGKAKRRRKEQMCLGLVSSFLPLQSRTISPNEMKLPNSCKNKCCIHHQPEINNHSMQINNSDSAKNTFKISHKRTKRNVA